MSGDIVIEMRLHVMGIPPYKQAPADARERENQKIRTDTLKREAKNHFRTPVSRGKVRLTIEYSRGKGKSDAANIIGGIADALNGITYRDDGQISEIHYREKSENIDEYWINVEEV
jgi:Holliday junction resolvase RusA-like endonuclease